MKKKLANFLIWLYKKLIGREPCIVYRRIVKYTDRTDGFSKDCPFCNLENNRIIEVYQYWYVIENKYPYPYTKDHLLIIPKRHISKWESLKKEEILELPKIITIYLDRGYFLLNRHWGKNSDASVEHLHLHLIL